MPGKLLWRAVLVIALGLGIYFLTAGKAVDARDFVGKWQSSRTNTPIHLAANGEWEIRKDDGTVLQYGIWRFEGRQVIWSVRQGGRLIDDANPLLSMQPNEFSLRELDGSTTVFRRVP